jgi:hypothetical protein
VNSYEAESRRINRYWDFNHTQGEAVEYNPLSFISSVSSSIPNSLKTIAITKGGKKVLFQKVGVNPEYPHTLDLRKRWSKN